MMNAKQPSYADDEVLVRVEGVSKKFCRSLKRSLWYGVCDIAGELSPFGRRPRSVERRVSSDESLAAARRRASGVEPSTLDSGPSTHDHDGLRPGEFWAVNDVSFELRRGECLGLIGHNGAGKTTLLKMLNGLIKPDRGRIEMNGRVGALIALGAGFNPILTGRENIYINGSVLGLSKKEIDGKIDEIIDFAEIGEFIDTPVQNYSSGMQVRLGFAVATALDPDILILDEVLAVGDGAFRAKCYTRIGQLMRGTAVIFVSHDMNSVGQMCTCGIAMDHGKMTKPELAQIADVLRDYNALLEAKTGRSSTSWEVVQGRPLTEAKLSLKSCDITYGELLELDFDCVLSAAVDNCVLRATVFSMSGDAVYEWNSRAQEADVCLRVGRNRISLKLGPVFLKAGSYDFTLLLADSTGFNMLYLWHRGVRLRVSGPPFGQAPCQVTGQLVIQSQ